MECRENGGQCERRGIVSEADPQPPRATERDKLHAADGVLNLLEYVACLGCVISSRSAARRRFSSSATMTK